jgi:CheY-like chemotaxis protein
VTRNAARRAPPYTHSVSVDSFTRVADSVARLLSAIVWPTVIVAAILAFKPDVRKRLAQGGVVVKAAGVEVTIEKATEAAAALGAAGAKGDSKTSPREVARAVATATTVAARGRIDRASVLWVDDHPENNEYERQAMAALGIRFTTAKSTPEALRLLAAQPFDVVITDLGRSTPDEDDPNAGLRLLHEMRSRRLDAPCIVYASTRAVQEREQLLTAGALVSTNRPTELFDAVVKAIVG